MSDHDRQVYGLPVLKLGPSAGRTVLALREAAIHSGQEVGPELRAAVCEYVHALRDEGLMAEHAVVLVNRAMNENGLKRSGGIHGLLMDRIVALCVAEFYR